MKKLRADDFQKSADFILDEYKRRKDDDKRQMLEEQWAEIARQIAMDAKEGIARGGDSGQSKHEDKMAWMAAIELPLQANALEVLTDDTLRLIFPQGVDWYSANARLDDAEMAKIRSAFAPSGLSDEVKALVQALQEGDQESLDLLVHSVMDYSHRQYDHTGAWKAMIACCLAYGTGVGRAVMAKRDVMTSDFRGKSAGEWPFLVPCSIQDIFLDDQLQACLKEGMEVAPSTIQRKYQNVDDLKMAAKKGGEGMGWIMSNVNELEAARGDKGQVRNQVQLIEYEGDLLIPRSRDSIYVPNVVMTVGYGKNCKLIRYRENPFPFRSYIDFAYQRDDPESPYGTSPLMKGRPLQEAATEVVNRFVDVATLNAQPPVSWDRTDNGLVASKGPVVAPGATWAMDRPEQGVKIHEIGDLAGLSSGYALLTKQYEDFTGVSDPRRGGDLKSHTTALATDIMASRSVLRTEEFVASIERGPLLTWLYMEYWMVRKCLTKEVVVPVDARGVQGHVIVSNKALPSEADFTVQGSKGALSKRERQQNFLQFIAILGQLYPLLQQENERPRAREIIMNAAAELGVLNAERYLGNGTQGFLSGPPGVPEGAPPIGGSAGEPLVDLATAAPVV